MNTPILTTGRLILRPFALADAPAYFELMKDEEVNCFLPWFPMKTLQEAEEHLVRRYINSYQRPIGFRYALCLKEENRPIGYINISNEDSYDFGYGLQKAYWNQGLVTQGSRAVLSVAKKAGIPYVTATYDILNPASGRVMEKLGMTYQYSYKELWQPKNKWVTYRLYQLNLDGNRSRSYQGYWNRYPNHFIEEI